MALTHPDATPPTPHSPRAPHPRELEHRAVKLTGLELALNRISAFQGSPVRAVDLLSWNKWNWIQLAERAGTTIPSTTTRSAFIERIAARDAAVLAANGGGR